MADDDLSDLSSLSSLSSAPSDDESDIQLKPEKGILKFFHKVGKDAKTKDRSPPPPPRRERAPSPPHQPVLADNHDIAFIVMFRNRFSDAFPRSLPNFGPQELESDIVESVPGERIEIFVCALLKLLLNRQQDVKPGHYHRALEEAVQSHASQWPPGWTENPLAEGKTFASMVPTERLTLLRALVLWTMASAKVVRDIIDHGYKGKRLADDANIALSIQPWGSDSDKRRYYLIEGRDDTAFRIYRESNPAAFLSRTWWSVAGSIDELRTLIDKLETADGGPKARKLAKRLADEIPRFEATEEKRRRREYRQWRKDQFKRPEPGFSLYEGRTRGKRIKYTYSDDDDFLTDSTAGRRRSTRNTGTHTPVEPSGPLVTASGRQIRAPSRLNGAGPTAAAAAAGTAAGNGKANGHSEANGAKDTEDAEDAEDVVMGPRGLPRRSAAVHHGMNGWASGQGGKKKGDADEELDEDDWQGDIDGDDEESEPDEARGDDDDEDENEDVAAYKSDEGDGDEDDDDEFDESRDALVDEEDQEIGNESAVSSSTRRSAVVKIPMRAVLDQATGQWERAGGQQEAGQEAGAAPASSAAAPSKSDVMSPGLSEADASASGTTVASAQDGNEANGTSESKDNANEDGDGDVSMSGMHSSDETANDSMEQQQQQQQQKTAGEGSAAAQAESVKVHGANTVANVVENTAEASEDKTAVGSPSSSPLTKDDLLRDPAKKAAPMPTLAGKENITPVGSATALVEHLGDDGVETGRTPSRPVDVVGQ